MIPWLFKNVYLYKFKVLIYNFIVITNRGEFICKR